MFDSFSGKQNKSLKLTRKKWQVDKEKKESLFELNTVMWEKVESFKI